MSERGMTVFLIAWDSDPEDPNPHAWTLDDSSPFGSYEDAEQRAIDRAGDEDDAAFQRPCLVVEVGCLVIEVDERTPGLSAKADGPDVDEAPTFKPTDDPEYDEAERQELERPKLLMERYTSIYRDGYYVVVDTTTGNVVPPEPGHYKKYRDGYLWDYAAFSEAARLNATGA